MLLTTLLVSRPLKKSILFYFLFFLPIDMLLQVKKETKKVKTKHQIALPHSGSSHIQRFPRTTSLTLPQVMCRAIKTTSQLRFQNLLRFALHCFAIAYRTLLKLNFHQLRKTTFHLHERMGTFLCLRC